MDPDFQLKVDFVASGFQRVQKLFLAEVYLQNFAKLMTTLQERFPMGGSHNANHMTIFLDHATNFLKAT